jgi:PhnB protein
MNSGVTRMTFKPQGYNSASPYVVVPGAQRLIDFLGRVFDARVMRQYDNPDGTIMHAEVMIDDSIVMLGDSSPTYPPNTLLIHVYVSDVDEVFKRALAAGGTEDQAPQQRPGDPDRRGSFKDFAGNTWAIATQS